MTSIDAAAVELELSFRVAELTDVGRSKSEILDLVFRHAKARFPLELAPPPGSAAMLPAISQAGDNLVQNRSTPLRLLDAMALFATLTEGEKEALALTMTRRTFGKGETLVEQGEILTSLGIMRRGVASLTRKEDDQETELRRLAPGDFFGVERPPDGRRRAVDGQSSDVSSSSTRLRRKASLPCCAVVLPLPMSLAGSWRGGPFRRSTT